MKKFSSVLSVSLALVVLSTSSALAQAPSRGSVAVFPVVFDDSGTTTSRAKAKEAMAEIFRKGGFKVLDDAAASKAWRSRGFRVPTSLRPPTTAQLASFGRTAGVKYVSTAIVTFHTRSIWVNLGPKTISNSTVAVTIVESSTGKVVYERDGEGRSDEKTDNLKVVGALLISPLVTAVSGGPKTPQETRAAQIASTRALQNFVVVDQQ